MLATRPQIWGLEALRVVDASIMPTITPTYIAAPVTMIAEQASRMILDDRRSP